MEIIVEGIKEGSAIPVRFTCSGPGISPEISWRDLPRGTVSLALIMDDPDAPRGTFTHWLIWGVSPDVPRVPSNLSRKSELPNGIRQGVNSSGSYGYTAPCPPPGPPHRYVFKLMALDANPDLPPGASRDKFDRSTSSHVLAESVITGLFSR